MNKVAIVTAALIIWMIGLVGVAQADMYSDVIDFNPDVQIGGSGGVSTYSYTHDVTGVINLVAGDTIDTATLYLTFWDDEADTGPGSDKERIDLFLDLSQAWNNNEMNSGQYDHNVLTYFADGKLDVKIHQRQGDVWLCSSEVKGEFTPIPTPAPAAVLLGMLGLGVAGLKLRRHA